MVEGRVVEWSPHKGLGIIQGDDGAEAFVHHTQIVTPGFKNLVDGQRVRYEVKTEPRGAQAVNVTPLPLYETDLSPEEWKRIEPRCAADKLAATARDILDPWQRSRVTVTLDLKDHERVIDWVGEIQGELKAEQPKNPTFIVYYHFDEGAGSGWVSAGADTAEAAEALLQSKLKDLLPEGVSDGEIIESVTLAEYEEEWGRTLPLSCYPKPGELLMLG